MTQIEYAHIGLIIAGVVASTAFWFWMINKHDRLKPEPLSKLLLVLFVGGFCSSLAAGIFNTATYGMMELPVAASGGIAASGAGLLVQLVRAGFIGINEEFWKFFFTFLLIRRMAEFDEPIDGIIYAMTAGLGFAAFENIDYGLFGGVDLVIARNFHAVPLHLGASAVWGLGLTKAKFSGGGEGYLRHSLKYIAAAAALHAGYDFICFFSEFFGGLPMFAWLNVIIGIGSVRYAILRMNRFAAAAAVPATAAPVDADTKNFI